MDQKALRYKVEFLFSYHYITLQQGDGMNAPLVKVEVRGRVGLLTLDRPKALNALSNEVIDELSEALRAFDADENIGAIVLTEIGRPPCRESEGQYESISVVAV